MSASRGDGAGAGAGAGAMRFGAGYWSMAASRLRPRHHVLLYEELCRDAQLADELGFSDYWLVEHHNWYDGHGNALFTSLGALAACTERIGIGTSCLLLPLHDPLRVAEMAGTVDRLSGGRLKLCFGIGYRDVECDALGINRRTRPRRMEDGLALLTEAWSRGSGAFGFQGRAVSYEGEIDPQPRPVRAPLMYLGGFMPVTVQRAARFGCGLQLGPVITAEQGGELVQAFHAAGEEHGVDTSSREVGICRDFWIAPTMDEALKVGRPRLYNYYGETVGLGWKLFRDESGVAFGTDRAEMLAAYAKASVDSGIIGDPDHVAAEIERLRRNGFNYVQLRLRFDSQPWEAIRDAMTLFAEQVMPRFAGAAAVA
jgi:alkanesulfonate monooxygenase SsuD/methylene tetrahydromethanopterin reductase-like flavin-dependent oxidoreductase (luciferase family)